MSQRSMPSVPGPFMGLTDEVVAVLVGPEKTPFYIHKGLLCSKSAFFRAAFEGSFREASEKQIYLEEENPEVFQHYAAWIYSPQLESFGGATMTGLDMDGYCRLYLLAEKLSTDALQNMALDKISINGIVQFATISTIQHVYENTLPESRLRKLLVDLQSYQYFLTPNDVNLPAEFLHQVATVCINRLPRRLTTSRGRTF
ncbi:MAG: hypothetical protein Q9168_006148 [Polycauliona sp. 1 TL-2023]